MGVLDDSAQFYAPALSADWSFGDIAVAPTAVLWAQAERCCQPYPQPAPTPDGSTTLTYGLWSGTPFGFPDPAVEIQLSPVVIAVEDCVIDKDFNAYLAQAVREGRDQDEAIAAARADPTLDPLIPVAPILPYGALRGTRSQAVRTAQAIGYFPIADSDEVDEGYVDFTRIVPVSRRLLAGHIASMSEPARRILAWKLAQFYAVRNLTVDTEIMAALGRTITRVHVVKDSQDRLVVDLELDGGASHLCLRQEPRRPSIPPGETRGRDTALD